MSHLNLPKRIHHERIKVVRVTDGVTKIEVTCVLHPLLDEWAFNGSPDRPEIEYLMRPREVKP